MQNINSNNPSAKQSPSEKRGVSLLKNTDLSIFSPGISTCGFAEIKMALQNKKRQIIATTIDTKGYEKTKKTINQLKLSNQIHVKIEDITKPIPYTNKYFDFIYARLILHYLTKQELDKTLKELHRVLKPNGRIFIVVRKKDWEANTINSEYNNNTKMTTYPLLDSDRKHTPIKISRYLHTKNTISNHLKTAGFSIEYIKEYKEQLFRDYSRTSPAPKLSSVIELLANKIRPPEILLMFRYASHKFEQISNFSKSQYYTQQNPTLLLLFSIINYLGNNHSRCQYPHPLPN
ncbi:MAG: class I SAM-dependent methyltransferase [Candidatus Aenigmarchaeota archaeon]|nr:class I SAM-dependent methyltransferase [Candidatus Aenigmarchaeota archaeon]